MSIERWVKPTAKIGLFAIGHKTYWHQFEGLLTTLMGYHQELMDLVAANEVEVIDFGMIDDSLSGYAALKKIQSSDVDLLMCNMVTYGPSSTIAPIIRDAGLPMIMVALQPLARMDYQNASTRQQLENDSICAVPEFASVAIRFGKPFLDVIIGTLRDDPQAKKDLADWCNVAKVLNGLKGARFGLMGHVLEAMYDMHADPAAISKAFGVHVPLLEVDDVIDVHETITQEEIDARAAFILANFDTPMPVSDPLTEKLTQEDLQKAAHVSMALDHFVKKHQLSGLAYFYNGREGSLHREIVSSFIVGNSILNARGFPMCGEFDIKTCIAMFIMDRLGIGGSFAELHPFDFVDDFIFIGHDGPHHLAIADGKPILRSLKKYHGKMGSGASVEFNIKEGPITMFGITVTKDEQFKFLIAQGESKKGLIPPTGNTNTRGHFEPSTKDFIKRWVMAGPTHHYALGIGHHAQTIAKIAQALGMEYEIID